MIQSLVIENFRGISRLSVGSLAKFNIFLGRNGVGKTTILESFSIAGCGGNPSAVLATCRRRDLPLPSAQSDIAFRSLFREGKLDLAPTFRFQVDNRDAEITIRPKFDYTSETGMLEQPPGEADVTEDAQVVGLITTYRHGVGASTRIDAQISRNPSSPKGTLELLAKSKVRSVPNAFTIQARQATSVAETAGTLGRLFQRGKEDDFLDFVRIICPGVVAINSSVHGGNTVISIKTKEGTRLLNEMGDGFCRLALIATGILGGRCKIIVIDEIDSGLHRSVMPDVWRALRRMAAHQPFQLIASTHNEDMLETAKEAFAEAPADLAVYRLDEPVHGQHSIVRYDYDLLHDSIAAGFDPRG